MKPNTTWNKLTHFAPGRALLVAMLASAPLFPAQAESIDELKQLIQQLDQKVRILERKAEIEKEGTDEKAKTTPRITVGNSGLGVSSADTNFVFQLHGLVQVDNRNFFNDGPIQGNDTFLLRRARPIFSGTLYHDFDFLFVPDFGGGARGSSAVAIQDAYLNYRYEPWVQLRVGKFKTPVGLELLQSDAATYLNERGLPSSLVPNRDVGIQLWGDIAGGVVSYAAGIFNGVGDAQNTSNADFDDSREFAGRVFAQPFKNSSNISLKGIGFGLGGSWGSTSVTNTAGLPSGNGFSTDGQQQFFSYNTTGAGVVGDGNHWRLSPQGYYYRGPLGLMAEYVVSDQRVSRNVAPITAANLQNTAWQVTASWVLTGEDATFTGVTPRKPFDLHGSGWGAVQAVARYGELDIDNGAFPLFANPATSASEAKSWSIGLNWYLNRNLTIKGSYARTTFDGGGGAGATAPAAVTRQPEELFSTRFQLAF